MKHTMRKLICLLLAMLLPVAASSTALAEAAVGQDAAYIVTGYRYANSASGQLTLYDEQLAPIGSVANGARLTVTNGEKDGYIYVRFGAVSGWAAADELSADAPETDSAPTLIPIQTDAPTADTETDETMQAPAPSPTVPQDEEAGAEEDDDEETADGEEPAAGDSAADEDTPADEDAAADEDAPADGNADSDAVTPQAPVGDAAADEAAAAAYENTHDPIAALYTLEDGGTEAVNVVLLGAVTSLLDTEEGILPVETARLTFAEDVEEGKKLGYIHAPRTGKAGLREQASKSSKTLTQLKAGQLVAVLALDGDFAHVNAQGQEGWLRLDCLRYLEPAQEGMVAAVTGGNTAAPTDEAEPETDVSTAPDAAEDAQDVLIAVEGQPAKRRHYPRQAQLSCQAETDGETSVNLRNLPTRESAKTAVWRTGKEVTVLSAQDGWYLVEANGTCGYVMEAFLTFEE